MNISWFLYRLAQIPQLSNSTCPLEDKGFLGLTPWYKYLKGQQDSFGKCVASISGWNDMWLIGLAIIDSLIKIAGLVAVVYVIYGGFLYMTSSGEPDKTKSAKDAILNALIGLVIAIIASGVVSFIGNKLSS